MNKDFSDKQINQMHITIVTGTKKKTKTFITKIKNVMKKIKRIMAILFVMAAAISCDKSVNNPSQEDDNNISNTPHLPVADFSIGATTGDAPVSISFSDKSTGGATSWFWEFGDGTTSSEKNPSHTYTELGKYTVKLTVSNADGSNIITKSNAIIVYEIKPYSIASVGPFYPARTNGDAEFDGHGPYIKVTANLLPPVGGIAGGSGNSQSLRLKLTMYAKETVSDWSTAYGEWYIDIQKLPVNTTFKDFLSSTGYYSEYNDDGHGYHIASGNQLGELWSMGDTDGDDICSGSCNTGDTHIFFKNFYCKVRIAPL